MPNVSESSLCLVKHNSEPSGADAVLSKHQYLVSRSSLISSVPQKQEAQQHSYARPRTNSPFPAFVPSDSTSQQRGSGPSDATKLVTHQSSVFEDSSTSSQLKQNILDIVEREGLAARK